MVEEIRDGQNASSIDNFAQAAGNRCLKIDLKPRCLTAPLAALHVQHQSSESSPHCESPTWIL